MADYRLSRLALSDLKSIGQYTVENWGYQQAEQYLDELKQMFNLLVTNPGLGCGCDEIRKGYRRIKHGRHVVFYRVRRSAVPPRKQQVEVIRILHERMLPRRHIHGE